MCLEHGSLLSAHPLTNVLFQIQCFCVISLLISCHPLIAFEKQKQKKNHDKLANKVNVAHHYLKFV